MEPFGESPVVLKGNDAFVVSPLFVGTDGETATDPASTPTVAATRADGTVIGTAPVVDDPTPSDGLYRAKLLAATHVDRLDELTLTWTGTITGLGAVELEQIVEVAGRRYVSAAEVRAVNGMSSTTKYPTSRILEAIRQVETIVEDVVGIAFVPRFARERLCGDGSRWLILNRRKVSELLSVTIDGTAQSLTDLDVEGRRLVHKTSSFSGTGDGAPNVILEYVHGLSAPPADLRRQALRYVVQKLLIEESPMSNNVVSQNIEGVTTRYSTPNPDLGRWTGDLEFDAVLGRLRKRYRVPGLA